jgi:hypothetical protein
MGSQRVPYRDLWADCLEDVGAFMACYKDSFIFFTFIFHMQDAMLLQHKISFKILSVRMKDTTLKWSWY